ncbi:uncharacterized protein LOC126577518 isoform X2 [Anopheles aquasalis]|uniref:uncharacterized protein LOC126577518 isoform X2 n=1 Tax=Anopheles aquasalis TaxID=42839 RepID=UPI00215A216F|nr:uncharacterized protein LOC126577518 isoform X2 [Anopheles aquasalis]
MTLRIIPLLLLLLPLLLLLGDSASATANNHQLSSSSSSSGTVASLEGASSSTGRLRGVEAAQLVDNKIHDKLQHPVSGAASQQQPIVTASAAVPQPVRRKREDAFGDSFGPGPGPAVASNYAPDGSLLPRITEDVLLVSNLTEERLREENELLEHLNRDRFPGRLIAPPDDVSDQELRQGLQRNGKKGRRRKGHKKHKKHSKIKLLPVTLVGLPVDEQGRPESRIALEAMETSVARNPWTLERTGLFRDDTVDVGRPLEIRTEIDRVDEVRPETVGSDRRRTVGSDTLPTVVRNVVDVVDVWKETTMPPPASSPVTTDSHRRTMVQAFPPPPVLVGDGHLVFGGGGGDGEGGSVATGSDYSTQGSAVREQAKRDRQQRKKFAKGEPRRIITPPLPARGTGIASSASTVTFPADDHQGTETVSVARVIIAGDLSCMRDDFVPAPAIANADIKYLRNDLYGLENSFLEAEYHCRMGYRLRTNRNSSSSMTATGTGGGGVITSTGAITNGNLVCRKSRWIGKRPACVRIKSSPASSTVATGNDGGQPSSYSSSSSSSCGKNHGCPQACHRVPQTNGNQSATTATTVCSCYKGFKMVNHRCVDVNECLLRNGHGPCQDTCINTWSSYRCTCDGLPGTRLAPDGHSCEDIDECTVNNGGCSHTCLNTLGRAFCVCPDGYMLDEDWKTCVDVDECANQRSIATEHRCHGRCINTIGSYRCQPLESKTQDRDRTIGGVTQTDKDGATGSGVELEQQQQQQQLPQDYDTLCPTGYQFNTTMGDCQDVNECRIANGGCQHHCINNDGSFYCSCKYGFKLNIDKRSCLVLNESLKLADVVCAPLFPPRHGYLECSRPIDEIADGPSRGSLKITNRPGSQCILKCPTGYRLEGRFSKICGTTGEWIGDENGTCIRYPQPKLICPTSVNVELHPSDTENTTVRLRHPETDVSWERDVVVEPAWAKKDAFQLPLGSQNVSYSARHPVSKLHTDCTFTINVLPGSPPRVDFCPDTQVYTIEGRHQSVKATWEEPVFSDNVGVVTITKSNSPGTDFGAGSHLITYEAHDDAEWKSRCVFKIVVNVNPQQQQQQQNGGQSSHLQLPILYNRFYF